MLDFKNINYIIGNKSDIQSGFSKVISFYDIIGHNMLLLHQDHNDSGLASWTHTSHKKFSNIDSFSNVLKDNLFRVNYLVVDIYLSATFMNLKEFENKIREITDIPIIFIVYVDQKIDLDESYKMSFINKFKNKDDVTIHKIYRKSISIPPIQHRGGIPTPIHHILRDDSEYIVSNILDKWETSFKELKLGYVRNKKLEDLFKDEIEE